MFLFDKIFMNLINLSVSASWLILAVLLFRFIFKKAPRWLNCFLWSLVAIRLICPFSLESALSLIPSSEFISEEGFYYSQTPSVHSGIEAFNVMVNPIITEAFAPDMGVSVNPTQIFGLIAGIVWLIGFLSMLMYALVSYIKLRKTVSASVLFKENQWICDGVKSPFILGVFRPKIYLPSDMQQQDRDCVIKHENAHLKRMDHLWKPFGFLLLSVYWFNPLMWLSYILLCRDIELACDEKVIKEMKGEEKKQYSKALLSCSVSARMVTACPIAFGEVGVKQRIKSVLSYKKPAFWVVLIALIVSVAVAVCFMTDPKNKNGGKKEISVYEIDEFGFPMYDIIMTGETFTVVKDINTYFDTFFGNGLGKVRELLQTVKLGKLKGEEVDHTVEIQYDTIIKIQSEAYDTVTVHFHDDYSKMYLQKGNSKYSVRSDDYAVLNVETVREFFEYEEYKNQAPVWEFNPTSSAYGYGQLHLYVDEKYEVVSFEASEGTINEMTYKHNDVEFHGVEWCPGLDSDVADVKIRTLCDGEEVDFNIRLTKVGVDDFSTFYYISAEDSVIGTYEKNFRYVFSKPMRAEYTSEVYWYFNPYAGGTWWYITQYILPDDYEIKSAEATNGTATVEDRFYNNPDGGKCVRWSPDFYEDAETPTETDIVIKAYKDGEEVDFKLKISQVIEENSETALKTYKITPLNCKMKEETAATYYLEEK